MSCDLTKQSVCGWLYIYHGFRDLVFLALIVGGIWGKKSLLRTEAKILEKSCSSGFTSNWSLRIILFRFFGGGCVGVVFLLIIFVCYFVCLEVWVFRFLAYPSHHLLYASVTDYWLSTAYIQTSSKMSIRHEIDTIIDVIELTNERITLQ